MEIISSIYNSGYNVKKFYLGSQELKLAFLGNQVIYDEVVGDNDLNYIFYEFYKSDTLSNTVEAPFKSAILKGNTLVNLAPKMEDNVVSNYQSGNVIITSTFNPSTNLKANTEYTLFFKTSEVVNATNGVYQYEGRDVNNTFVKNRIKNYTLVNGYNKLTFTLTVELSKIQFFSYSTFNIGGGCRIHGDSVMLIEGNYSNEDIPYFEGIQSVKMPVLTTSNEDGTKTNILTVNEDVTLRSNGDVYDELNLLTGRLTQRIDENNEVLAQEVVKTVDLTIVDQDGKTINKLNSFNGTTHVLTEVAENSIYPTIAIEVATE